MTDGIVFLSSYYDAIRQLPDAERLLMYDAIVRYGIEGELPELPPLLNAAFLFCKPNIDNSKNRYADAVENGKKGGRPRTKAKQEPTLPSASEQEPVLTVEPEENPVQEIAKPAFASENPVRDFAKPPFDLQNPLQKISPYPFSLQNQDKEKDKDMDMDTDTDMDTEKDIHKERE